MALRRILLGLLAGSVLCGAQARRPFTFEDMMRLQRVEEPAVSPDGKWVAFAAVEVNLEENSKTPHIWIGPESGGEARRVTSDAAGEDRPRFSPDGKSLIYVSAKEAGSQIWIIGFDSATGSLTGAARRLTAISSEAEGEIWSPDGKNILFVSHVYPECPDDTCNKQTDEDRAKSKVQAQIFTHLFYRHWSSYTQFKRSHLFVIPADCAASAAATATSSGAAAGTAETPAVPSCSARDITPGDHDVPPFSLGGQDMYAISPDGQEVAFTSNHDEVEATSTNNEILVVPITGGEAKKISTSPGSDSTPLYSPDGRYIAWRMQKRAGYESDKFRLVTYDRKSGEINDLTEDFDRWVGSIAWSPDSERIYFSADDKGESPLYVIGVHGGPVRELTRGTNDDLTVTPDGNTLVFTRMSVRAPNEIYKFTLNGGSAAATPVTSVNQAVLGQVEMPPMEPFWFTGAEKTKVEGFILRPPGFDASKKYPVKFLIHGGPQGAWGEDWSYRWNPELFAASGYVVVMINPRGSTGYGQKFIDEINGDWGGRPYVDLMNGLDYVERAYPFIDKGRECALGASYGGYMIDWLLGHTDRFRCLVAHDGMFNTESAYGTTEELWFNEWEFRGTPWTNRDLYRKWSPHLFAEKFKTPTLVIHSQKDYRLDVSEGFQLFTTLQRLKVPSKMLYFPDEGHWILKPQNSRLWYRTVNGWVDEYLKK
jgi:dipeptidyl aminopeptidase/acylaminoacyl peptidase